MILDTESALGVNNDGSVVSGKAGIDRREEKNDMEIE